MGLSVYFAAPLAEAEAMCRLAWHWRAEVTVCSRWHSAVSAGATDPRVPEVRRRILYENLVDIGGADVVLVDTRRGVPGATLCELGYALAMNKRVVWLQPVGGRRTDGVRATNIFDAHENVRVVHEEFEAWEALR
jgi:hypothetical protein